MSRYLTVRAALIAFACLALVGCEATRIRTPDHGSRPTIDAHVDARELPRGLLHSSMRIPAQAGRLVLRFPEWIPGTHGPTGQIRNLAELRFETPDGRPLTWRRDEVDLFRFLVDVPAGTDAVVVRLSYICNQSTDSSRPIDSHGGTPIGIVNWNTCLLYPEGRANDEVDVRLSVQMPSAWKYATALTAQPIPTTGDQSVRFAPASIRDVIDSPMIAGEHLRSVPLRTEGGPPVYLHAVSEPEEGIQFGDNVTAGCRRLVLESEALFGRSHFEAYHFLVVCTDFIGSTGLEHFRCSLDGIRAKGLIDEAAFRRRPAYLLPHEYVHSWCGKFRCPVGMDTRDYHTPMRTRLLWVYEGLAQYLGYVLAVRSGLAEKEAMLEHLAEDVAHLRRRTGRCWRPLVDTAVANHTLRGGPYEWADLRRGQDYYVEGALFWLEADVIIRVLTKGQRSLDDFCKAFLGQNPGGEEIRPFDEKEVIDALNRVAPYDWARLITTRIHLTQDELSLDGLRLAGYRMTDTSTPLQQNLESESQSGYLDELESIGLALHGQGKIVGLVKDSPAFRAGLGYEMYVMAIDGTEYTAKAFREAIAGSPKTGKIDLMIWDRGQYRNVTVEYKDGARYPHIEQDKGRPDLLSEILRPRASPKGEQP
jgi:predicted metalloprotease with PDZ domain